MNWDKITKDEMVKDLLIKRATIEQEIRTIDNKALIKYELEALTISNVSNSLPDSDEVFRMAHELDEKEFDQWMFEQQ